MKSGTLNSSRVRQVATIVCVMTWGAAFTATHIPAGNLPPFSTSDKVLHTTGYFTLTCLLLITLALRGAKPARRIIICIVATVIYGAFDEITQPLVNRCAAWGDWLADIVGAVAAIAVCELVIAFGKARMTGRRV